jgi:hypothetical protein
LVVGFLVSWTSCFSQQLSHQVLVPLAGVVSEKNLSYSQTVGETAVEIVGCSQFLFTQGFQQPGIKVTPEIPPLGTGVSVYPNPVSDFLTIELFGESARTFRIEIINVSGTVVLTERIVFSDNFWYREPQNIENLIRGFYMVRITSEDRMINRTFKIEKL